MCVEEAASRMAHHWNEAPQSLAILQSHLQISYFTRCCPTPCRPGICLLLRQGTLLQSRMWFTDHWKVLVFPKYQGE